MVTKHYWELFFNDEGEHLVQFEGKAPSGWWNLNEEQAAPRHESVYNFWRFVALNDPDNTEMYIDNMYAEEVTT